MKKITPGILILGLLFQDLVLPIVGITTSMAYAAPRPPILPFPPPVAQETAEILNLQTLIYSIRYREVVGLLPVRPSLYYVARCQFQNPLPTHPNELGITSCTRLSEHQFTSDELKLFFTKILALAEKKRWWSDYQSYLAITFGGAEFFFAGIQFKEAFLQNKARRLADIEKGQSLLKKLIDAIAESEHRLSEAQVEILTRQVENHAPSPLVYGKAVRFILLNLAMGYILARIYNSSADRSRSLDNIIEGIQSPSQSSARMIDFDQRTWPLFNRVLEAELKKFEDFITPSPYQIGSGAHRR